jgi:hypothetical protein
MTLLEQNKIVGRSMNCTPKSYLLFASQLTEVLAARIEPEIQTSWPALPVGLVRTWFTSLFASDIAVWRFLAHFLVSHRYIL